MAAISCQMRSKPSPIDPGCVKTLRGITAPGILGSTVMRRAKKRKNWSSARRYDQIRFRFHTWGNSGIEPYLGSGNQLSSIDEAHLWVLQSWRDCNGALCRTRRFAE